MHEDLTYLKNIASDHSLQEFQQWVQKLTPIFEEVNERFYVSIQPVEEEYAFVVKAMLPLVNQEEMPVNFELYYERLFQRVNSAVNWLTEHPTVQQFCEEVGETRTVPQVFEEIDFDRDEQFISEEDVFIIIEGVWGIDPNTMK
jgi:hypothetical protein